MINSQNYITVQWNFDRKKLIERGESGKIVVIPSNDFLKTIDSCVVEDIQDIKKSNNNVFLLSDVRDLDEKLEDLISVFVIYRKVYKNCCKLILILDNSKKFLIENIERLEKIYNLGNEIVVVFNPSEEQQKLLVKQASLYLSFSESCSNLSIIHKAMQLGLPIVAYNSGYIPEIIREISVLFSTNKIAFIASIINEVLNNQNLYKKVSLCQKLYIANKKNQFSDRLLELQDYRKSVYIENCEKISAEILNNNSRYCVVKDTFYPDIHIACGTPLHFEKLNGGLNFYYLDDEAYDFSCKIEDINFFLDGIITKSQTLFETIIENGVNIPVRVIDFSNNIEEQLVSFFDYIYNHKKIVNVSMVSTWNSRCGIAEYTKMEVQATSNNVKYRIYSDLNQKLLAKDEKFVKRCWTQSINETFINLSNALLNDSNEIVHIQFHYGLFQKLSNFAALLENLVKNKKVVITFHKTADNDFSNRIESLKSIVSSLNKCSAFVVHSEDDKVRLIEYGVTTLIKVIKHGQIIYPEISSANQKDALGIKASVVIGSYGFLLPHKGIFETIQAVSILKKEFPDILYLAVCSLSGGKDSSLYYEECSAEIEKLGLQNNVRMITDFLPNEESMKYLKACDVMVMPYKPTQESASGAIRFCIAAARPMVTSKQKIFDEAKSFTCQIEEVCPEEIASGIKNVLEPEKMEVLLRNRKKYVLKTSWYATAEKLYSLYREITD